MPTAPCPIPISLNEFLDDLMSSGVSDSDSYGDINIHGPTHDNEDLEQMSSQDLFIPDMDDLDTLFPTVDCSGLADLVALGQGELEGCVHWEGEQEKEIACVPTTVLEKAAEAVEVIEIQVESPGDLDHLHVSPPVSGDPSASYQSAVLQPTALVHTPVSSPPSTQVDQQPFTTPVQVITVPLLQPTSTSLTVSHLNTSHDPATSPRPSASPVSDVSTPGISGLTSGDAFLLPLTPDEEVVAESALTSLIKDELKQTIQSRRKRAGKPELVPDNDPPRAKVRKEPMTAEEERRYWRRRDQNRQAAQRFRQRQRDTEDVLSKKCQKLEGANSTLLTEIQRLTKESQQLQLILHSHLPLCSKLRPCSAQPDDASN